MPSGAIPALIAPEETTNTSEPAAMRAWHTSASPSSCARRIPPPPRLAYLAPGAPPPAAGPGPGSPSPARPHEVHAGRGLRLPVKGDVADRHRPALLGAGGEGRALHAEAGQPVAQEAHGLVVLEVRLPDPPLGLGPGDHKTARRGRVPEIGRAHV